MAKTNNHKTPPPLSKVAKGDAPITGRTPFYYYKLDVINTFQRANVMAIQNHFAFQFVPVLLDVVVFHHDDHHIHLAEELVEVENLVWHQSLVGEEGVEALQRTSQMAFLNVDHLEGWAFAHIVHILLIGDAIQTHAAVVGDVMLFHNLMDALQHEHRLVVVGLH